MQLGPKSAEFNIGMLAIPSPSASASAPVALCMHGHGSSCCVASWAAFFPALHAAGFQILALDAPCFGRSSGPAGQANLWRSDDAALVLRLLDAFGVGSSSGRCVGFAQCMGGAMFLRSLATAPGYFSHNHVTHNCTIGTWPAEIGNILAAKGGKLKCYHMVDPDHLREAVAFKHLTALMHDHPELCHFTDVERVLKRGSSDSASKSVDILLSDHVHVPDLSRDADGDAFMYTPDAACIQRLITHVTAPRAPRGKLAPPTPETLPEKSAVELGISSPGFGVVVRIRPPLEREDPTQRCLQVTRFDSQKKCAPRPTSDSAQGGAGAAAPGIVADEIVVAAAVPSPARTAATSSPHTTPKEDLRFVFQSVCGEETTQQHLYEQSVRPLLDGPFIENADATIFAYGQTGSGKTFTTSGAGSSSSAPTRADAGIIPRVVDDVFARLHDQAREHPASPSAPQPAVGTVAANANAPSVTMTYIEIYNGVVTDLLLHSESASQACTLVEERASSAGSSSGADDCCNFQVEGATAITASSPETLLRAYAIAATRRSTAGTKMNDESSRSHAVLTLKLPRLGKSKGQPVINIVDLAGSERVKRSGATGARMDEAISINSSLLALARVVRALVSKQSLKGAQRAHQHVPYRGSVLTKLLASSLGGRARTVLIACVAPTADSREETISTLRFASIATHIKNEIDKEKERAASLAKPVAGTLSLQEEQTMLANAAHTSAGMFPQGKSVMVALPTTGADTRDVECYGDFTAGLDQPCVLLLHYYDIGSEGGAQFLDWFRPLSEAGYRCLAPSFPGHGRTSGKISAKPDADVLGKEPCQFVSQVLDYFGIRKAAIVLGYDWGGGIAVEYAIRKPARVGSIVGWSISHRDQARTAKLKKRYGKKKNPAETRSMFLGQKNSIWHPFAKQKAYATACGMSTVCVKDDEDALQKVVAFAQRRAAHEC